MVGVKIKKSSRRKTTFELILKKNLMQNQIIKKMASDLHRTAQPRTLAMFPSWGSLQELVV